MSLRPFATGLLISSLLLSACHTTSTRRPPRANRPKQTEVVVADAAPAAPATSAPAPEPTASIYRDPVARATLREKALALLASAAVNGLPEERANAMEALSTSPARLYPLLDNALADPNVGVRAVAAMTVGRSRLDAAAEKIRPLTSDASGHVRAAALYALKRCGEYVDLSPMAGLLRDPDLRVRAQTAFLLGELGEPSAIGLLKDSARESVARYSPAEVRVFDLQLAEARIKLGDEGPLQDVRAALFPGRPEDLEATALACQIAGQVRDQAAVNRLIVLTAVQDDSKQFMPAEIRLAAAAALARLGQRQGGYIADQYRTSDREALRAQAASVYGETGQVEHLPTLAGMMADNNGRVRVAAAAGIIKITEASGATP